ncbi:porin family protein [Massilia cavernae]|uniref:Porin family protein n=1 Tax=Massilia cavernae TaxID=2320864 RepID=A0A418XT87_9BURK|nr:porin family protein [Massilia cavernae]RJG15868.1 porin family protein [Massilia cavernae]
MKKLIFALIAGVTAMGAAQAAGPYVGVGVASADHTFKRAGASNVDTEGYKASGKFFGGYEMDQNFGVEAGYTDFRNSTTNFVSNGINSRAETEGDAIYVAAKANAPINEQFSVFGKLGAARTKSELRISNIGLSSKDHDTGVYAGLGAQYNLSQNVALTAEYERYGKKQDIGAKPDVITVAARYSF